MANHGQPRGNAMIWVDASYCTQCVLARSTDAASVLFYLIPQVLYVPAGWKPHHH